jgi:hypothetical protein
MSAESEVAPDSDRADSADVGGEYADAGSDSDFDVAPDANIDDGSIDDSADAGVEEPPPTEDVVLPDGTDAVVMGDPTGQADYYFQQGDNSLGYGGTCGLASSREILAQFGIEQSEDNLLQYALDNELCVTLDDARGDAEKAGGTTPDGLASLLSDHGVSAHISTGATLEDLASEIEQNRSVIACVDSGVIRYQDQNPDPQMDHALLITGVARDPNGGNVVGFYVNDTGTNEAAKFVDADTMERGWTQAGGVQVVTDQSRRVSA